MSVAPSAPKEYPPIVMVFEVLLTRLACSSFSMFGGGGSVLMIFASVSDQAHECSADSGRRGCIFSNSITS